VRDPELAERIRQRHFFHVIDLGDGLVTAGDSRGELLCAPGSIPDVTGRSVLDIGAWDGKFSFLAESRGARRVVALDHYVWRLDWEAREAYYRRCEKDGVAPDPDLIDHGFLVEGGLPGKAGFDLVHAYLASSVEAVADDFMTMDLDRLGSFDVVLYFGVLYHMVDPIGALRRVRRVTGEVAVIETAGVVVPSVPAASLTSFYPADELNGDYGNWFAPTPEALAGMCRAAGFSRVTVAAVDPPPRPPPPPRRPWTRTPPPPAIVNCRIVVHARP